MCAIAQGYVILLPIYVKYVYMENYLIAKVSMIETFSAFIFGVLMIFFIKKIDKTIYLLYSSIIMFCVILCYQIGIYKIIPFYAFIGLTILFIFFSRYISIVQYSHMFKEYNKNKYGVDDFNRFTNSTMTISSIIIAPIFVFLYNLFLYKFFLIILLILVILMLILVIKNSSDEKKECLKEEKERRIEVKSIFRNMKIMKPIILLASIMLISYILTAVYFLFITVHAGFSYIEYSFILVSQSIGSVMCSMYLYKFIKRMYLYSLNGSIILLSILYSILYLSKSCYFLLIIFSFVIGILNMIIVMHLSAQYQMNTRENEFSTVNSIRTTLNNSLAFIGAGIGSYLYIIIEIKMIFILASLFLATLSFFVKEKNYEY